MTTYLLSIGVNAPRGTQPLRFAERDATRITYALTSAVGFVPPTRAITLCGPNATTDGVRQSLATFGFLGADHVTFYFSGHGSQRGIALANGRYDFATLGEDLRRIRARTTTVIADTCRAGAAAQHVVGGKFAVAGDLSRGWLTALRHASPGGRLFAAASETQSTREDESIAGGRYTWAFLEARRSALPDVFADGEYFASDLNVGTRAATIMTKRWSTEAPEVWLPPQTCGPMPFVVCEAAGVVGSVIVRDFAPANGPGVMLALDAHGRRQLRTDVTCSLFDPTGRKLFGETRHWFPTGDVSFLRRLIALPNRVLTHDAILSPWLRNGATVDLVWELLVHDSHGRVLGDHTLHRTYWLQRAAG